MNVLVVEDEPTTRMLLRRVLVREFDATVAEATNGHEAIEALAKSKFAFVVLDLQMPVMDGVATLEAIRRFPELAALPIVVMTVERNEERVRHVVELGISDYLTKPLDVDRVSERLGRLVAKLASAATAPGGAAAPGRSVVVVDGRSDYRRFVAHALTPGRDVLEAESGLAALKTCFETRPAVVIVGSDIGLIGPELLAHKLRHDLRLAETRIIGVLPGESHRRLGVGDFDGFVPRTANAARFAEAVAACLGPRPPAMAAAVPDLREQVVAAIEQVMGMLFAMAVEVSEDPDVVGAGPGIESRVRLSGGPDKQMDLVFSCRHATAHAMGAALSGSSSAGVADEAIESAITTLCNVVAGRLRRVLSTSDRQVETGLPVVQFAESLAEPSVGIDGRLDLRFRAPRDGMAFRVTLLHTGTGADSAAA